MYQIKDIKSENVGLEWYVGVIDGEPLWGPRTHAKVFGVIGGMVMQRKLSRWPGREFWQVALVLVGDE